ncbi:MAG: hypothetical protein M3R39_09325 [Actinomycetota bacterium]|nr:hypothetical protein [Actinomycetota bacterium]
MELALSEDAARFLQDRGGRLYVWPRVSRCCHGVTFLKASTEPPGEQEFRHVVTGGLDVFMPARLPRLPDELHVELRRFPRRRVEAYWDGCAWVI